MALALLCFCVLFGCSNPEPDFLDLVVQGDLVTLEKWLDTERAKVLGTTDPDGNSIVGLAMYHDRDQIAGLMIAKAVDVDMPDANGWTYLHWACVTGKDKLVDELLKKGAEVDVLDSGGFTPLILAARGGRIEAVRSLIASGANINHQSTKHGASALMLAGARGHDEVVALLLKHGVDVSARNDESMTAMDMAEKNRKSSTVELLREYSEIWEE